MTPATEQLLVWIVTVAISTVVLVVLLARHVTISYSALLQAIPAIIGALVAIQRAIQAVQDTQEKPGSTTTTVESKPDQTIIKTVPTEQDAPPPQKVP